MDFEENYTIIVLVFNCFCLILPGLPFAHLQLKGIHEPDHGKRERETWKRLETTFVLPKAKVVMQYRTWKTANTKMKIWSWWIPYADTKAS